MGLEILVDGYNVIKNNEPFRSAQRHGLLHSRTLLIKQLQSKYRHTPHRVTVVFDGDGANEVVTHEQRIQIIFSRRCETADQVIVRLSATLQAQGRLVETISDDLEIRHGVTKSGGELRTTRQLTNHLNAPSHDVAQKIRHRQKAIREYGLNPQHKAEDDDDGGLSGQGKKVPRRRR
ncbi:MAG TPA: NYN domain-containing protein [Ktedonobacteraceae bacterium]|nr:NYN domain-containing protein [Ktedonobacteraceae bacterium]